MNTAQEDAVDGEIVEHGSSQVLSVVPKTLSEIAAMRGEAKEIIEARVTVLKTLRVASIRATSPSDWLLYQATDRRDDSVRTTGYLQDAGCQRVASLWGIEIFGVSDPVKVSNNDGTLNFMYFVTGNGRCMITGQTIEGVEGGRASDDDFCRGKTGVALELAVRKSARANLDGNVVRKLSGLSSVPLEELQSAWEGTGKDASRCVKGRGFGSSKDPESGSTKAAGSAPKCSDCGGAMWDNRTKKQSPNSPDFKCKDTKCGKAIWEKDERPKANGSSKGAESTDDGAETKKRRALIRGQFGDLGWDEKRQDKFCGGRDLSALNLDELIEINTKLAILIDESKSQ